MGLQRRKLEDVLKGLQGFDGGGVIPSVLGLDPINIASSAATQLEPEHPNISQMIKVIQSIAAQAMG